jgi:hypothetical protein
LYHAAAYRRLIDRDKAERVDLARLWGGFFAGTMAFIFLVYTSSTLASDSSNYRFYILFVYCAVTLLAITLGLMKHQGLRLALGGLLVVATLFNLGFMVKTTKHTPGDVSANLSNHWNFAIIEAVKAKGLTKGYGSYWQANVNTYLSKNQIAFLPSLCAPDGVTAQFRWLIDGGQFDRKAGRSFYVLDPYFPSPRLCTVDQLVSQFGQPQEVLQVGDKTILIFDYDISNRMRRLQY